jgi:hypothetical protein
MDYYYRIQREYLSNSVHLLPFAGRQSPARFEPLDQSALAIPNGAPELDVGRAVSPHPSFGEPRYAQAQKVGRFPGGQQMLASENSPL